MKNLIFVIVILVFSNLLFSSCSKCGKNIDLGFVDMSSEVKALFPYTGTEKIVLKNGSGEEVTLERQAQNIPNRIENNAATAARLCEGRIGDTQNAQYDGIIYHASYISKGRRQMSFFYHAEVIASGSSKSELGIVDKVTFSSVNDSFRTCYGTNFYNLRGNIANTNHLLSGRTGIFSFAADTTIGGKSFKNVINLIDARHSISIAREKGLVALKFDNELFMVDRLE